jgi:hypothetical protein
MAHLAIDVVDGKNDQRSDWPLNASRAVDLLLPPRLSVD